MSHELRGPLGVARGYVSMLADGTLGAVDDRAATVLPVVLGKLDEIGRMVDQMLLTARLEDSRLSLDLRRADLRRILDDSVALVRPRADARGTRIVVDDGEERITCLVDSARIVTVLTNLLDNAVKYSAPGSTVRCCASRRGGFAAVAVRDRGPGIAPEDMARLFTRFGRAGGEANRGIPGTGLGLYISRELARRHGGDITVDSRPGSGSTFVLTLPMVQD